MLSGRVHSGRCALLGCQVELRPAREGEFRVESCVGRGGGYGAVAVGAEDGGGGDEDAAEGGVAGVEGFASERDGEGEVLDVFGGDHCEEGSM